MKFHGKGLAAGALMLALTGCSVAGPSQAVRNRPESPWVEKEIQALRQENAALAARHDKALERLDAVATQLKAEREDRARFREMMTTNFDLLEQSVALSLSKKLGRNPVVNPKDLKIPEPQAQKPAAVPPPALPAKPMRKPAAEPAKRAMLVPETEPAEAASRGAAGEPPGMIKTVAAMGPLGEDPALRPPANPHHLGNHRAAKPLYDRGFSHFAKREYGQAILVYEDFLKRFPDDGYSDNAQFWIGEAHFQENQLDQAEQAYRNVLRNYEHRSSLEGYKTPEAMYRLGQTYLKRNDPARARQFFAAAAERFPTTSAGRKAQRELATMMLNTAGAPRDAGLDPDS